MTKQADARRGGALRIGVVGHVEHVTLGKIDGEPHAGDVLHMRETRFLPGGGGAIAFAQLCRSDAEIHFFTALGNDAAAAQIRARFEALPSHVHVHAAPRDVPHPRVVVVVDANAHRTIIVTGEPLQAAGSDALDWSILATCDAVYFTGAEPGSLVRARESRCLVATARRRPVFEKAGVMPDVIVGSASDPRENAAFGDYKPAPSALVLTDGGRAIRVHRATGKTLVEPVELTAAPLGDYGAGDSFAGALTYFLAASGLAASGLAAPGLAASGLAAPGVSGSGFAVENAARRAAPFGAAVLRGIDPLLVQDILAPP